MNPSFSCFVKFTLSLVDKVTIGTYNFVLVILNVVAPTILDIKQFLVQLSSKLILQLVNGISNDLKKLDIYFKGTTIFALLRSACALSQAPEAIILPSSFKFCSSLLNCHKPPEESA